MSCDGYINSNSLTTLLKFLRRALSARAPKFSMHTHSQYTSTVRVKVSDPATLLAVIWYTPLSLRVMSAIVKLVAVTVNLVSVTSTPFLVSVISLLAGGGLASSGREKVNGCSSVGVAVAAVGENRGGSTEEWRPHINWHCTSVSTHQ